MRIQRMQLLYRIFVGQLIDLSNVMIGIIEIIFK